MLADLLASALNQPVTAWRSAPSATAVERQVVRWLHRLTGFDGDGGLLVSGGSAANFHGLACAVAEAERRAGLPAGAVAGRAPRWSSGWWAGAAPGGKCARRERDGLAWDARPPLLTMPRVLDDLFAYRLGGDRYLIVTNAANHESDLAWLGGLTEGQEIQALAHAFERGIAPHDCAGPVGLCANLHLLAASPNALLLETVRAYTRGFYPEILSELPRIENGYAYPVTAPGLGTEFHPDLLAAFDQNTIRVIHENGGAVSHVCNGSKLKTRCFNRGRRCRNPARTFIEKTAGVGVRKGDRFYARVGELTEKRMLRDDLEQCFVGKALLVITDRRGRVDARENRRLPGSALRPAFAAESRIGRHDDAVEKSFRRFVLENRERHCAGQVVEGIERTAGADA